MTHKRRGKFYLKYITLFITPSLISSFSAISVHRKRSQPFPSILHVESTSSTIDDLIHIKKENLLDLLQSTPTNAATSTQLTNDILSKTKELETMCPTPEENVLQKIVGNWELVWTAQDKSNDIVKSSAWWRTYIK